MDDCFARPDELPALARRVLRRFRAICWVGVRDLASCRKESWKATQQQILFCLVVHLSRCSPGDLGSYCSLINRMGRNQFVKTVHQGSRAFTWRLRRKASASPLTRAQLGSPKSHNLEIPRKDCEIRDARSRTMEKVLADWADPTLCCRHSSIGPSSSPPQR